jgi:RNA polymerase sigma-70 factor (ECF subfamily)
VSQLPVSMNGAEKAMVQRLVRQGDTQALASIMRQYAGMVYGTCRRVLRNDADAADATQETFFQLLRNADAITGSLSGWLHQVATRRAIDRVRQDAARRRREEAYAANPERREDNWQEIEPLVDEALEELPEESREVLVLHYLKGQSMNQIAALKGLSQPTISRRAAAALEELRQGLRDKDVIVGVGPLGVWLAGSPQVAPELVLNALGKIALVDAGATATPVLASGVKTALAIMALAVVIPTAWLLAPRRKPVVRPPEWAVVDWSKSSGFANGAFWHTLALYTNGMLVKTQLVRSRYPVSVGISSVMVNGNYSCTLSWFRNGVLFTNQTVVTTNPALLLPPAPW